MTRAVPTTNWPLAAPVNAALLGTGGYRHQTESGWPSCSHGGQLYSTTAYTRPRSGVVSGERISIRLDANDGPVQVAYYIHSGYCTLPWGSVAQVQAHPVSYSADGTHASYPTAGGRGLDQADQGPLWHA